jgi:ABC-2 family transporter protein
MGSFFHTWVVAFILLLIYALAAVPWAVLLFDQRGQFGEQALAFLRNPLGRNGAGRKASSLLTLVLVVIGVVVGAPILFAYALLSGEQTTVETVGMLYGATLQLQLVADFFILGFPLLMKVWPKGGAVAYAAFREGVRQPLFWVLFLFGFLALLISLVVPYFTFGEDLVMVKDLGFDTLMLAAALFGTIAASQSISEEIEGRTAVTLMSKPVSRRQFLLGKFVGILMASLLMYALLGWFFEGLIPVKAWLDRMDPQPMPTWLTSTLSWANAPAQATNLLRGVGLWVDQTLQVLPGLVMTFSEVMVLLAVAVALATRATMVVNLATVLAIYFLANVTPVLVTIGQEAKARQPGPVSELLSFTAGLFNMILPDLDAFRIGPALVTDVAVPAPYVLSVLFYGVLYTLIVLLFGLILFEDRDLA